MCVRAVSGMQQINPQFGEERVKIQPVGAGLGASTAVEGYFLKKSVFLWEEKRFFSHGRVRGVAEPMLCLLLQQLQEAIYPGLCSGHSSLWQIKLCFHISQSVLAELLDS